MRYDVTMPRTYKDRDGNEKTRWLTLGSAWEKDGKISVQLDALPLPDANGQCRMVLIKPKQN